jgi:hypothetical protein
MSRVDDDDAGAAGIEERRTAAAMIDAGTGGSIVAVSSISGTVADRDRGAYYAHGQMQRLAAMTDQRSPR